MNKSLFVLIIILQFFDLNAQVSKQEAAKADSLISLLSQKEKISMLGGRRIFYTNGIPEKGINPVLFSDATQGIALRPAPIYKGWKLPLKRTVAFPAPILLASTWDTDLAYRYAEAIGEECRAAGIGVLLGPGLNMYRISQCGRNFEYFGDHPYLVSQLLENYVKGVQSTGTIATLKHFVANNSDYYRRKSNSLISERALNEIYLPAFKAGIDAGAGAVMTAYNLLDGEW
jgi:beta-glucosidase